jgi:hypothetical protein
MPTMNGDLSRIPRYCKIATLRGRKAVRKDGRLRTDDEPIGTQSTIWHKIRDRFGFIHNRVFGTDGFYPYQKHGWRAQRAGLLLACDGNYHAVYLTGDK